MPVAVIFVVGLAAGLLLPVVVHRLALRWDVTRLVLLGLRPQSTAPGTRAMAPVADVSEPPPGAARPPR